MGIFRPIHFSGSELSSLKSMAQIHLHMHYNYISIFTITIISISYLSCAVTSQGESQQGVHTHTMLKSSLKQIAVTSTKWVLYTLYLLNMYRVGCLKNLIFIDRFN